MNIVLIGAQGSGKGTQAAFLTQKLGIRHIGSGDLLRKAVEEKTPLGIQAGAYMDRGELVPDDITVAMVLQCIGELASGEDILLDGFPRTLTQAQTLDRGLRSVGRRIDKAIYLNVPRNELLSRLDGRYLCRAAQHIYHKRTRPPKITGICDLDGSPLYQRPDDSGEAVQKRLDIFFHETIRLLDYYREQNKLSEVNANQSIPLVSSRLLKMFRPQRGKSSPSCSPALGV